MRHTATPLELVQGDGHYKLFDLDGRLLGELKLRHQIDHTKDLDGKGQATADFIVRAYNTRDGLVAACKFALVALLQSGEYPQDETVERTVVELQLAIDLAEAGEG